LAGVEICSVDLLSPRIYFTPETFEFGLNTFPGVFTQREVERRVSGFDWFDYHPRGLYRIAPSRQDGMKPAMPAAD
jgi:hypothetical protein